MSDNREIILLDYQCKGRHINSYIEVDMIKIAKLIKILDDCFIPLSDFENSDEYTCSCEQILKEKCEDINDTVTELNIKLPSSFIDNIELLLDYDVYTTSSIGEILDLCICHGAYSYFQRYYDSFKVKIDECCYIDESEIRNWKSKVSEIDYRIFSGVEDKYAPETLLEKAMILLNNNLIKKDDTFIWVSHIDTELDYRKQGYAKKLLFKMLSENKEIPVYGKVGNNSGNVLKLENYSIHNFYKNQGFTIHSIKGLHENYDIFYKSNK